MVHFCPFGLWTIGLVGWRVGSGGGLVGGLIRVANRMQFILLITLSKNVKIRMKYDFTSEQHNHSRSASTSSAHATFIASQHHHDALDHLRRPSTQPQGTSPNHKQQGAEVVQCGGFVICLSGIGWTWKELRMWGESVRWFSSRWC